MEIHIISIFPEMFSAIAKQGVIARAIEQDILALRFHNPRDFTYDKHSTVDGRPYGGGPGMVMRPEPLLKAILAAKAVCSSSSKPKVVYLSPQGRQFDHKAAQSFSERESVILLAGRYEGIDERLIESQVDEEWSIGDYVLSGGELPAMVMIDAVARLLPDSLGNEESAKQDSFVHGMLDCPHYTRPESFVHGGNIDGEKVPDVLLSGDHPAIEKWRMQQALGRTWLRRPELLNNIDLTDDQQRLLDEFKNNL